MMADVFTTIFCKKKKSDNLSYDICRQYVCIGGLFKRQYERRSRGESQKSNESHWSRTIFFTSLIGREQFLLHLIGWERCDISIEQIWQNFLDRLS
jgi:hypothetical protein